MSALYVRMRGAAGLRQLCDEEADPASPRSDGATSIIRSAAAAPLGRVLLVDPMQLRRAWLTRSLTEWVSDYECLALASVRELSSQTADDRPPIRLVVVSIGGADVEGGWVADELALLRERFADLPVVVLADRDDLSNVRAALRLGVRGYLPTSVDPAVARSALQLVLAGGSYAPPTAFLADEDGEASDRRTEEERSSNGDDARAALADFTPRQREVLRLLGEGRPNKVIARRLGLCESTVKVHVRQIMRKLRASNRTEVALKLRELMAAVETSRSRSEEWGRGAESSAL